MLTLNKCAYNWYSELSMNEQEQFRLTHPYYGKFGKCYFFTRKNSILHLYLFNLKLNIL